MNIVKIWRKLAGATERLQRADNIRPYTPTVGADIIRPFSTNPPVFCKFRRSLQIRLFSTNSFISRKSAHSANSHSIILPF
ncbi:MAG: hypothetical protein FWG68_04340 [Defluviitaleaceae bacterium]|nr:hypothetical protein [Defluviitaleaceae bacterium]